MYFVILVSPVDAAAAVVVAERRWPRRGEMALKFQAMAAVTLHHHLSPL
jgi:hypothetical protein